MPDIIQMLKNSGNPQGMAYNLLQQQAYNNPAIGNILSGNQSAETIARNLCRERGIDADALFNQVSQQFQTYQR